MEDRRQSATSLSQLSRRFSGLTVARKPFETGDEFRGPLGLNLLYEPTEPLIDFVFVHGLRGGSRKTWSKTQDVAHYWPLTWLPLEPEFKNVRIHSFGYSSDWSDRKASTLTIHDFGQALLGDLSMSPQINQRRTPLVLIGHSMGGVVIKKAFLLAKRDPNLHQLASRFQSIFFLATPHRGADSARLLENMLRVSGTLNPKAYVGDLKPNSVAIQSINDEFRHVYQSIQLWSFFETIATSIGIIVEKDAAILGLPNEKVHLLNADHRNVCKFADETDDNYRTLRNAFISTINHIETTWYSTRTADHRSAMNCLSEYLGIGEQPEADLFDVADKRTEGSCLWLTNQPSFQSWQRGVPDTPKIFWLVGEPGAGKSVLAGHVVDHLIKTGGDCHYYFFKHGDATKSTVSNLITSIAWQMSHTNAAIRDQVLSMQRDGDHIDRTDERALWRSIFVSKIFQVQLRQPCYWVIDALDECANLSTLLPLISKVDQHFPLYIFLTSRPSPALDMQFQNEKIHKTISSTSQSTSLTDIRLFVETKKHFLPVDDHDTQARKELVHEITERSNGNFLWASLVIQELATANSEAQVRDIMNSVPNEMDGFYHRILDRLLLVPRNVKLAKTILRWTVCAARPLTTNELKDAIKYDIGEVVPQLDKKAGAICGHLVFVDKNLRVRLIHATVRAYLIRDEHDGSAAPSDFSISRVREHSRLAAICLDYLSGPEMKPPKHRPGRAMARQTVRSAFADYATANFAEHVARATSGEDAHLQALHKFLRTNVLTWIESVASRQNLHYLILTAKQLKQYMDRRAKYVPPMGEEIHNISSWTTDLVHIVAEFGKPLLASPSSIHFLIPPLCPSETMIRKLIATSQRAFCMVGLSQQTWDDRLSCIHLPETGILSVSSCDTRFCLSLDDETVRIYNSTTIQEELQIEPGDAVLNVRLASSKPYLVTASHRDVQVWNSANAVLLWRADIPAQALSMEFSEDDSRLYVALKTNTLLTWQAADGLLLDTLHFKDMEEDGQIGYQYQRAASHAAISPGMGLLAVAYRVRPITVWDIEEKSIVGQFHKGNSSYPWPLIIDLLFNPEPDLQLAAAAYQSGDIVTLDPCTLVEHATVVAETTILAASPNGIILAAAQGSSGTVNLYEFETLKLLYRLNTYEEDIMMITFASNSLRFFDVRGEQCNIWEPSILVRQGANSDDSSLGFSEEIVSKPEIATAHSHDDYMNVNAVAPHHDGDVLFCGRENGSVAVFSVSTGKFIKNLRDNKRNIAVLSLSWCRSKSMLGVAERSTRFKLWSIQKRGPEEVSILDQVLDIAVDSGIRQAIFSPDGNYLLISTGRADILWSIVGKKEIARRQAEADRSTWSWITQPGHTTRLLLLCGAHAHIFAWNSLEHITRSDGIEMLPSAYEGLCLNDALCSSQERNLCVRLTRPRLSKAQSQLLLWPSDCFREGRDKAHPTTSYPYLAAEIKAVIGVFRSDLLFQDQDGWICSLNIETLETESYYVRHFFIPFGWHSTNENRAMGSTDKGSIFMAVKDEIAVFHNGLDHKEKVPISSSSLEQERSSA